MARKISKTESKKDNSHKWIALSEIKANLAKRGKSTEEIDIKINNGSLEVKIINDRKMCSLDSWNKYLKENA